jgi:hypothetical protein
MAAATTTKKRPTLQLDNYFDDDFSVSKRGAAEDDDDDDDGADNSSVQAIFARFERTHKRVMMTIDQYKPLEGLVPVGALRETTSNPSFPPVPTSKKSSSSSVSGPSPALSKPPLLSSLGQQAVDLAIVPDDRVIVPPSQSDIVSAVLKYMVERKLLLLGETLKITLRLANPLGPGPLTWGDLRKPKVDEKAPYENISRVDLKALVKCGVSLTDLRQAGVAATWEDLKQRFAFNPTALSVNYAKLNLARLKNLYHVDWVDMAIDFQVGIYDYLINFALPLQDLNMFGLNMDIALHWRDRLDAAYVARGYPSLLREVQKYSHLQRNLLRDVNKEIFLQRMEKLAQLGTLEMPQDWVMFFGMNGEHVLTLGLTKSELLRLWGRQHKSLDAILDAFGCTTEQKNKIAST